ncbi:hypothetical protein OTU49_007912 [Cherax quadricarinatus]|uniref:Uncharacterized protein n=1 Tax=Cherax quadricarinatus TaxID=27406 RepID=A0AAW0WIK6_CHEQU
MIGKFSSSVGIIILFTFPILHPLTNFSFSTAFSTLLLYIPHLSQVHLLCSLKYVKHVHASFFQRVLQSFLPDTSTTHHLECFLHLLSTSFILWAQDRTFTLLHAE